MTDRLTSSSKDAEKEALRKDLLAAENKISRLESRLRWGFGWVAGDLFLEVSCFVHTLLAFAFTLMTAGAFVGWGASGGVIRSAAVAAVLDVTFVAVWIRHYIPNDEQS